MSHLSSRYFNAFILILLMAGNSAIASSPCSGLKTNLDVTQKNLIEKNIMRQLNQEFEVKKVDVLAFFTYQGWSMVYENDWASDESILVYSGDILHTDYVAIFSGAVSIDDDMEQWIKESAPGIPDKLAQCFSWYSAYRTD